MTVMDQTRNWDIVKNVKTEGASSCERSIYSEVSGTHGKYG